MQYKNAYDFSQTLLALIEALFFIASIVFNHR